MKRSCENCFNCVTRVDLLPNSRPVFRHYNPQMQLLLNMEIQCAEVRCKMGYWTNSDGSEFWYSNFERLPGNPDKFKMAEHCLDYTA